MTHKKENASQKPIPIGKITPMNIKNDEKNDKNKLRPFIMWYYSAIYVRVVKIIRFFAEFKLQILCVYFPLVTMVTIF